MIGAEVTEQFPLLAGAGRRDDARALRLGDLQGGEADAAGAAVDQHPVAGA